MNIVYVDDKKEEQGIYSRIIRRFVEAMRIDLQVLSPETELKDMVSRITEIQELKAIILDERMDEAHVVKYSGIILAEELRAIYPKIPIYILTSFPGDISDEDKHSIDCIIQKNKIADPNESKTVAERLKRHIETFQDVLVIQNSRFQKLLQKRIEDVITDEENDELEKLGFFIKAPILYKETRTYKDLEKSLKQQSEFIEEIEKKLGK